jgi:hypothetical protein
VFYRPCFDNKILDSTGRDLREPIDIASPDMHSETGMFELHKLQSDKEGRPGKVSIVNFLSYLARHGLSSGQISRSSEI